MHVTSFSLQEAFWDIHVQKLPDFNVRKKTLKVVQWTVFQQQKKSLDWFEIIFLFKIVQTFFQILLVYEHSHNTLCNVSDMKVTEHSKR